MPRRVALLAVFCLPLRAWAQTHVESFAARAALAARKDVDAAEAKLVASEQVAIASGATALAAYQPVQDAIGLLFDAALGALRHTLAAGVATKGEQQRIATLERQVSGLVGAQGKEPVFFWHGPKWMILSKLRAVFDGSDGPGSTSLQGRLQALAEKQATGAVGDLGQEATKPVVQELSESDATPGVVPPLGLAVGDAECGEASSQPSCDLAGHLRAVAKVTKGAAHLLVLPSSPRTLDRIAVQLREGASDLPQLYVSLGVPWEMAEAGAQGVGYALRTTFTALGRQSVDLVWLPYGAFKKRQWQTVKQLLSDLMEKGIIRGYGVHAEVHSKSLAAKLLDRQPKPAAWLTQHDLLRPSTPEAVAAARDLGIRVVALPRGTGVPSSLTKLYLEAAVGKQTEEQEAAQLRWALGEGLAATVRPDSSAASAAALGRLNSIRLTPKARGLLTTLGGFCQSELPPQESAGQGLRSALSRGQTAAKDAASETPPPEPQVVPSIASTTMDGMEEQRKLYKANNHVIYKEDFFDPDTFAAITAETKRLWRSEDIEANCNLDGQDRLGGYVLDHNAQNTSLYKLIYGNEAFRRWVSAVNNEGEMWPADFPIELREYGVGSKGMMCHPDLQMYAVPKKDLEFVVTVDNNSSCNVTFEDAQGEQHVVHTRANSLMMVRVNAAVHCVTPTVGGTRTILKFIFVGDYRKSPNFWTYTDNTCDDDNRNRQLVKGRRAPEANVDVGSLEL